MSQKYSKLLKLIILPTWVFISFYISQIIVILLIKFLEYINSPIISINEIILNTSMAVVVYIVTIIITIGAPWIIKKHRTTADDLGITRLPTWTDILLTPAAMIIYFVFSAILIILATNFLPWFDVNQIQETGFDNLTYNYEYVLAFATLVVLAPVAEEILFRGYLYGKLRKFVPIWLAMVVTSLLFGFFHGAWNLAFDTFALSIVLCFLRESTGSIWSSVLLHMVKNGIAFYILFINPLLLVTIG